MDFFKNNLGFCDFLHVRENYPLTKNPTKSSLGIILSILMILTWFGFIFFEISNYYNNYTLSFSQEYVGNINEVNELKINVTFGFQIENETSPYQIDYRIYNSFNNTVNYTYCNEKFEEISYDVKNYNNIYRCFINYTIVVSDKFNHFLKIHLINNGFSEIGRVPFKLKFKDPIIDHNLENPFVERKEQQLDLVYFYDTELQTYYRKYLKIVDYKTESLLNTNYISKYYLEDFEDNSRINAYNNTIYNGKFLGTFRLVLAKKKEVYIRKYLLLTDFISKIGGYFSSLKIIFTLLTIFLVNPNDNLRIFYFLKKNKPSIYNRSVTLIKDSYKNNGSKMSDIWDDNTIKEIKGKDKFFYLCYHYGLCCQNKCCKKSKNKHLEAIDNYFNENLTIDKYLEESFIIKNKFKIIQKNLELNNDKNIDATILNEIINNDEYIMRKDSLQDEEINKIQRSLSKEEKEIYNIANNIGIELDERNISLIDIDNKDSYQKKENG